MTNKNFIHFFVDFLESIHKNAPFRPKGVYQSLYKSPLGSRAIYNGLKNLEVRGVIRLKDGHYLFTDKGKSWLTRAQYKYFRFRHGPWDKKWRLILFDIPSNMEKQRQAFRRKLKYIGCYMIQKSVFVFPYPCEKEIGDWCQELDLIDHVDVLVTEHLGSKESEVKKHFEL